MTSRVQFAPSRRHDHPTLNRYCFGTPDDEHFITVIVPKMMERGNDHLVLHVFDRRRSVYVDCAVENAPQLWEEGKPE